MKIRFLSPQNLERNIKATIHKSGKMGFTIEAANKLGLSTDKSVSIGINEDDENDKNFYVVVNNSKTRDAFSVLKAGDYYYLNTKPLLDSLKIDYLNNNISFDIEEQEIENQDIYIFKRRDKERKTK